ncbi:MAG: helix-turn-helix transcriptional regulator [Proteobacteria bacterium]|nr:helix-turn-helix transcriptional regulator [Pseudomonadota bacterium]
MVNNQQTALDHTFAALADPTRRAMLARLAAGEASVGDLAAPHAMSLPAISKHLKVLERAGLIARRKDGRVHRCSLDTAPMDAAVAWIESHRRFWQARFDALDDYLADQKTQEDKNDPGKPEND